MILMKRDRNKRLRLINCLETYCINKIIKVLSLSFSFKIHIIQFWFFGVGSTFQNDMKEVVDNIEY